MNPQPSVSLSVNRALEPCIHNADLGITFTQILSNSSNNPVIKQILLPLLLLSILQIEKLRSITLSALSKFLPDPKISVKNLGRQVAAVGDGVRGEQIKFIIISKRQSNGGFSHE